MTSTILVAGIGNIFHRDDAFGVCVATELAKETLPENVRVQEFGIRGFDLGLALLEDHGLMVLVDAVSRGEAPGTVYTLEVDPGACGDADGELQNAHGLDPARVLAIARRLGAPLRRVLVIGCEPETLDDDTGQIGLTETVQSAVDPAIRIIRTLIDDTNRSWAADAASSMRKDGTQ